MSLDIGVGDGVSFFPITTEPSLSLDDNGYYWYLYPLFEKLQSETGQFIDLYGHATFQDKRLAALERLLSSARELVESQPASWSVQDMVVEQDQFSALLAQWRRIVARAKDLNRPVVCFGD
jgi:hypothetical protein